MFVYEPTEAFLELMKQGGMTIFGIDNSKDIDATNFKFQDTEGRKLLCKIKSGTVYGESGNEITETIPLIGSKLIDFRVYSMFRSARVPPVFICEYIKLRLKDGMELTIRGVRY